MPRTDEETPLLQQVREKERSFDDIVEPSHPLTLLPLSLMVLVTGIVNITAYQSTKVWPGFQTGCTLQIGANIPRWLQSGFRETTIMDAHLVISLAAFNIGAFSGALGRIFGQKLGSRRDLFVRGIVQVVLLVLAGAFLYIGRNAENALQWDDSYGLATSALLAAAQGMQGLDGQTVSTELATTVVQTSVWLGLSTLPFDTLFKCTAVRKRDLRIFAILLLFIGGMLGHAINTGRRGAAICCFVAAGIRMLGVLSWMVVEPKKKE